MSHARSLTALAVVLPLALAQCKSEEAKAPVMTPASRTMTSEEAAAVRSAAPPADVSLTDAEIAGLVDAANTSQTEAATAALSRASSLRVRTFAELVVSEHERAQLTQERLEAKLGIEPVNTDRVGELQASAATRGEALQGVSGAEFDSKFIDSQVSTHMELLELLNQDLIPNANREELREGLRAFRSKIENDLGHARYLQRVLIAEAAASTAP